MCYANRTSEIGTVEERESEQGRCGAAGRGTPIEAQAAFGGAGARGRAAGRNGSGSFGFGARNEHCPAAVPCAAPRYGENRQQFVQPPQEFQRRVFAGASGQHRAGRRAPAHLRAAYSRALDSGRHTVGSLVGKFGKSEAYILSRLKLCAQIDPLADLLDREEISVGIAIEIAKYDDKIQQEVFDEHFAENCRSSWKNARIREVARRLYQRYMTQLDTYRFDKSECMTCLNNTANQVLFRDCTDGCAGSQNMDCMIRKNEAFLKQKAIDLLHNDPRIVLAADDDAPAAVMDALTDDGYNVESLEYVYNDLVSGPQQPEKPLPENFEEIEEYNDALMGYQAAL